MQFLGPFLLVSLALSSHAIQSFARVKTGDSYLIKEAIGADAIQRNVGQSQQIMQFQGPEKGIWIDENGRRIGKDPRFQIKSDGSVLILNVSVQDSGTYQKYPNPMVFFNGMGFPPSILILEVTQ